METLVYPTYLRDSKYAMRSITFSAMTHDINKQNSADSIKNSIRDSIRNLAENATNKTNEYLGNNMSFQGSIVLPLPNNIVDTQGHSWGAKNDLISEITKGAVEKVSSLAKSFVSDTVLGKFKGMSVGSLANTLGTRQPIIDPGFYQQYDGSSPRSFTFMFDLIPDSVDEAQTIQKIILALKEWSSPSLAVSGTTMLSPMFFMIEFGNPYITRMFNMNCCVLTNIQIDYCADGAMQQFADGFPKQMTLTLTFNEARLSYAQNYSNSYSSQQSSGESSSSTPSTVDVSEWGG